MNKLGAKQINGIYDVSSKHFQDTLETFCKGEHPNIGELLTVAGTITISVLAETAAIYEATTGIRLELDSMYYECMRSVALNGDKSEIEQELNKLKNGK